MKHLWIVCGVPGSGKSTWLANNAFSNRVIVSRDKIRFSMIGENDPYFKYEKEVWDEFLRQLNEALVNPDITEVYADATHLTFGARKKLILGVAKNLDGVSVNCINFIIPLKVCLERNENRKGRSYVPRGQIRRMYEGFDPASIEELIDLKPILNRSVRYEWIVNVDENNLEEWIF